MESCRSAGEAMPGGGEGVCGEDDGQGDHAEKRVWESESLEDERVEHKSHPCGGQLYTFVKSRKDHSRGGEGRDIWEAEDSGESGVGRRGAMNRSKSQIWNEERGVDRGCSREVV